MRVKRNTTFVLWPNWFAVPVKMYQSCDLNDVSKPFSWFDWFAIWFTLFMAFPILKLVHEYEWFRPDLLGEYTIGNTK